MSADFWAGYISGAAGIIVGNPLDLIKTRQQAVPRAGADPAAVRATSVASLRATFDHAGTLVRGTYISPSHACSETGAGLTEA
jgi:solute carrier family 25 carnitine/acylcarnitine transporter 20/29